MSDRYAYLYETADTFSLRALVEEFSSKGITLENPANGRVTALSEDGDQIEITLNILETAVANHNPLTFQFWMPGHADICCRLRHLSNNRLVEEYWLDGLSQDERARVLNLLIERFKSKTDDEDYLFLVGDREGYTFELDWDSLSLEGKYEFALCPDVLGIPLIRLGDFEKCANGNRTMIREYIIIETASHT